MMIYFKKNNNFKISKYENILKYLFPHVDTYCKNKDKEKIEFIKNDFGNSNQIEYKSSIKEKRVYNGKFFKLYFNKGSNEFINIVEKVNYFVKELNNNTYDESILFNRYMELEKIYPGWIEKYTTEFIELYLNNINNDKLMSFVKVLCKSYYKVDDSYLFLAINAQSRTAIMISILLMKITNIEFENFIIYIKAYKNLNLISQIGAWIKSINKDDVNLDKFDYKERDAKFQKLKNVFDELISDIKTKKINMYTTDNYALNNIGYLLDDEEYLTYIKNNINIENLMLFLLDCISKTNGTEGIGYEFQIDKLDKLYGFDRAKKDIVMCKNSKLKEFLVNAFNNLSVDSYDEKKYVYHSKSYINLNELVDLYFDCLDDKIS